MLSRHLIPVFLLEVFGALPPLQSVTCSLLYGFLDFTFPRLRISRGGPGSVGGIATAYGLDGPGSNPGVGEIFRTCPDRP